MHKTEQLNIRLTERILERLRNASTRDGLTVSEFVRLSMLRAIEKSERNGAK